MSPLIMHVDIDAFFASVEQLRNPSLRGKPVIVGAGVIASCSYEARRYGLRAGMPLYEALRLCPSAVILDGHAQIYRCFAERVFDACARIAPGLETHLDEAYCDLTGTDRLYGDPLSAGEMLRASVRNEVGLSVTVGLGVNRMVAKMAGKTVKPGGLRLVRPGREREFVSGVSVRDIPGVGRVTYDVLRKLNVHRASDLTAFPLEYLRMLFGRNGEVLYRRCRGMDGGLLDNEIPASISRETSFSRETGDRREIEGTLHYLAGRAARTLRSLGLSCRTVSAKVRYADGGGREASRTLPSPTRLDGQVFDAALGLLGTLLSRRSALRLAGVSLSSLCRASLEQGDLYDTQRPFREADLCDGLDRVRDRFGHGAVVSGRSLYLNGKVKRDRYGYILRTPSLTK
jgi:DNA polymerase-4